MDLNIQLSWFARLRTDAHVMAASAGHSLSELRISLEP